MKRISTIIIFVSILTFEKSFSYIEFFDSQKEFTLDSFRVGMYYSYSETMFSLQKVDTQQVLIDLNGRQYKYFSEVTTVYHTKLFTTASKISVTFSPLKKLYYNLKLATIGSSSAFFDNSTKRMDTIDPGLGVSLSIHYTVFPETLVNCGIICGSGFSIEKQKFSHISEVQNIYKIDTEIEIKDYFLSFVVTKKFTKYLEPYFGGKMVLRESSLFDRVNFYKLSGTDYLLSLNLGSRIFITKSESLNLELLFTTGVTGYSAVLGIMLGY